jgi:hypothetical protein
MAKVSSNSFLNLIYRSKGKKKLRLKGPQGDAQNVGMHQKKGVSTANIEAAGGRKKKK